MNISRIEQRVLHALAQGGCVRFQRGPNGKLVNTECITHDGSLLVGCTPAVVSKLRRKRLIQSVNSGPYRISLAGRQAVRPQLDNRVQG